ncbi:MATE family efflux transporter [Vibrio sp. JC009]|uniref:MATE family efflux transporter n=1 Tax=Vibrio sp. JC009 TaxID=2912314 RepID=UPI0023B1FECC|nr:MATE family efflux transporter [Vibrio sp. JC009]WED23652.1 MATE family efflux transporter [Vibrio sp. JC009]
MLVLPATLKLILSRTLPLTVGVFAMMLVQLVDTIFIGQLGVDELTVQGITLPFNTVIIGFQVGIGVAATCIISRELGNRNKEKANVTAFISVVFGIAAIAVISLLLWLFKSAVFSLFISADTSPEHITGLQRIFVNYWPIWLVSAISGAALYLISAVYRANEDTKTPGFILVAASVINLILDPILIFALDLGINGAAIATCTAFLLCTGYLLLKARGKDWFSVARFSAVHQSYFIQLLKMTAVTTINQILPSVSAVLGMFLISGLGTDAIAFWSLMTRIETFILVLSLSLTMSIPPIVGRYLGEGNVGKISDLLSTTAKFLLGFHFTIALIVALGSDQFVPLLSDVPELNAWMAFALLIIPFSYGPLGLCMVVVSTFNALGLPKRATLISFIRLFVFYIPAIWLGTQDGSVTTTIVAATVANLLAGLNAWWMLKRHLEPEAQPSDGLVKA